MLYNLRKYLKKIIYPPSPSPEKSAPELALLLMLLAAASGVYAESIPDKTEALDTPTEVAVSAANRRLTVAWRETPGATRYKVAIRPKNQLFPAWSEYTTPSSPYTITDRWAMSGMEYEVRVAAVNAAGPSEWSPSVPITAPALQAAPADAIGISDSSPLVGEFVKANLASQRPFTNQSPFYWSICNADGAECKLLPRIQPIYQASWKYLMMPETQGKRVSVQIDYDKDGVSYSAMAVVGVVGAARTRARELATHLYALDIIGAYFRPWDGSEWYGGGRGGAIAPLSNDLLVATPWGKLALVRPNRELAYLEGNVPMNKEELQAHPALGNLYGNKFRVADILLKQHSAGRYDLFVTHHYFTGKCIRFRLSATTLVQQGADVSVSPAWRTIFDAEPCLNAASDRTGGRMLTDGPDHLLVVIGDHALSKYAQDPNSHLGKLVRIEIETGRALTLASGLRNPQGLTRDAAGTVWETEHGPHGGDELNLLELGGNYGWPLASYGLGVPSAEAVGFHDGFTKPVFAWLRSIGISNLVVNDEHWFPLWKDDLLISSLRGHALFRVRRHGAAVQYVERIRVGERIRDLAQMPDGRIALLSDGGKVYFLSRSYAHCNAVDCPDTVAGVAATGAQLYDLNCNGCHSLNAEEHGRGPHLVGVVGRRIGAVDGYLFSDALRSLDEVWTQPALERFLANPQQFAPGTSKSSLSITPAEARAIADFIRGD